MTPLAIITIDGVPASTHFIKRLISVSVTDKDGTKSDTIDLMLNGEGVAVPRKKAIITATLGYVETGVSYFGSFTADDIELGCYPFDLKIQGKSADMRDSLKEHKERHWDGQTFGGVAGQIASENGLAPQISGRIAGFKGKDGYFNQEGESGLHYVQRLARRLDALFVVKDGKMILADKGSGMTAGGAAMGGLVVTPPMIIQGTCKIKFTSRDKHKKVRAAYHDNGEGKRKFEEAQGDPESKATHTIRHQFGSKEEAKQAASATAKSQIIFFVFIVSSPLELLMA